ncbi:malto-oligosyltrehalose trehalohydrolase [Porifericola rhodea]|uniref:malto-oligosyltrehalose trehalohydrolase n=1 Tax=Porifericola rhodea TaxID=930972 RepID=UPI00266604FB|nr:malto-oligosyltrehalose trehalohydrolase [Porifericola rhodea]WKN30760.1 malto-oligosyltrehalose trehalohydrolase [Porifericola rhodea]
MEKPVGAFYQNNKTKFNVWAPHCKQVNVIINDQHKVKLTPDQFGYWEAEVPEAKAGDLYFFELDGKTKRPDPASLSQPEGVHGPSQIVNQESYKWSDSTWKGIPMSEMIMYELHVGTFTSEHNFEGVISKLDHLKELGVNTIEIMPVAQFPGSRNWGYDGVYPFAVQNSYGGVDGLKKLVDHCHQMGIAVVLDVVYNHMGPEGNYLNDFGPYFTDKYSTPWGKALNFDDAYSDQVRAYFLQNALMWLDDFHIDGLRLDAVHAIKDFGARHFLLELSEMATELSERRKVPLTLIGESDLNDNRYISSAEVGGYGLSGQWIDEFHHALHAQLTGEKDGYYSDFGEMHHLAKAYDKTYVYDGIYSPHRKKTFGNSAENNPFSQFVVFSQNHDQVGNRMMGDRLSQLVSYEALKLAAASYLLSPYVPMLYMGEEYAEEKPFQYFVSHTDPDLVEAVRKGRSQEFAYFQKEGLETPDPQSEQTFDDSTLSWNVKAEKSEAMLNFYKKLINIRTQHSAMQSKDRGHCAFQSTEDGLIAMRRTNHDHLLIAIMNFSSSSLDYSLSENPAYSFEVLLDSSSSEYLGPNSNLQTKYAGEDKLSINSESVVVLSMNTP